MKKTKQNTILINKIFYEKKYKITPASFSSELI
jgi:hypothetical protein